MSGNLRTEPQQCEGFPGKCPGTMDMFIGLVDMSHRMAKQSLNITRTSQCKSVCLNTEWCLMAEFNSKKLICNLYDHNFWKMKSLGTTVYSWRCCQPESLCYPLNGKCSGYWISYENKRLVSQIAFHLDEFYDYYAYDCWYACFRNKLCGSINYRWDKKTCYLNRKWGYSPIRKHVNDNYTSYEWRCCRNHTNIFSDSKCQHVPSQPTCVGKYIFNSSLVTLPIDGYVVGVFRTQDPHACLRACQLNSLCIKPFYRQQEVKCFLFGSRNNKRENDPLDTYVPKEFYNVLFQSWRFSCCLGNTGVVLPTSHAIDSNNVCLCIMNTSCVRIYRFDCSSNKNELSSKTVWKGMAFYFKGDLPININKSILISNGYRKYRLSVSSETCIKKCADYECEAYSGVIRSNTCPTIVKRGEWNAQKAKTTITFSSMPKYVVIMDTIIPSQSCYTFDQCSDLVRDVQNYDMWNRIWYDTGYNFFISGDGTVYEGRGWNLQGAHSKRTYNEVSICIVFIGWFEHRKPSVAALNAAKELIQCGVSKSYIEANYTIVAHRDVRPGSTIPGMELYKIISNWPHYIYDSKKPLEECTNLTMKILLGTLLSALVIVCMIACLVFLMVNIRRTEKHKSFCGVIYNMVQNNGRFSIIRIFHSFENFNGGLEILDATDVNISIPKSQFYFLSEAEVNCECYSIVADNINYAAWMKRQDVCSSLSLSSNLKFCGLFTLILVNRAPSLFEQSLIVVLHLKDSTLLHQLIEKLPMGICVCRERGLLIKEITVSVPKRNETSINETPSDNLDLANTIREFKHHFERIRFDEHDIFYDDSYK